MVTPEKHVPEKVTKRHVGRRVLYRLPNQAVISEGVIEGLSPEGKFVCIGKKRWVPNSQGQILSFLSKAKNRRSSF